MITLNLVKVKSSTEYHIVRKNSCMVLAGSSFLIVFPKYSSGSNWFQIIWIVNSHQKLWQAFLEQLRSESCATGCHKLPPGRRRTEEKTGWLSPTRLKPLWESEQQLSMRLQHVSHDIKNIIDQVNSHWELLISKSGLSQHAKPSFMLQEHKDLLVGVVYLIH